MVEVGAVRGKQHVGPVGSSQLVCPGEASSDSPPDTR